MKKWTKILILLIVFIILSALIEKQLDDFFMNTIYTVAGIMFSIGIGLVVTFNLHGIKNKSYIKTIRSNLNEVRNSYILYFSISTVLYITDKYLRDEQNSIITFRIKEMSFNLNISLLFLLIMLYSIAYYIGNFLALQKLNDDIFDKLNE
jgi:hypothetical protein